VSIVNDTFYDNSWVGVVANMTSTVYVTNTIVYSHDQGLSLNYAGSVLMEDHNLLSNTKNYTGTVITGANTITGQDPLFLNVASDDFHLDSDAPSPAIDKGTSSGAPSVDFEGDTRPQGDGVDIGADEAIGAGPVYLPVILKND
jgi:hypothetical protein